VLLGRLEANAWNGVNGGAGGGYPLPDDTALDADPRHPLVGHVLVFTGALSMLRADAWKAVAQLTATPEPNITKRTTKAVIFNRVLRSGTEVLGEATRGRPAPGQRAHVRCAVLPHPPGAADTGRQPGVRSRVQDPLVPTLSAVVPHSAPREKGSAMSETAPNRWAVGLIGFAGFMMILVGFFQALAGFAALLDDDFYVVGQEYIFQFDSTTWGWIHLLLGVVLIMAGLGVWRGGLVGRTIAVIIVGISAIANFIFLLGWGSPVWSTLLIALDVAIIWALTAHGRDVTAES
jgi:hypothetical protein